MIPIQPPDRYVYTVKELALLLGVTHRAALMRLRQRNIYGVPMDFVGGRENNTNIRISRDSFLKLQRLLTL